jgi:hypothetical protein
MRWSRRVGWYELENHFGHIAIASAPGPRAINAVYRSR